MRLSHVATTLALVLSLASTAAAEDNEILERLGEALEGAVAFEQGANSGPLAEVERIVFQLPADSDLRGPIEQSLLDALETATAEGKRFLCRQLRVIGTAKSVPALEKLLADREVSHMARYALVRLESPDAAAALQRALGKTTGRLQAGIVHTLADRAYTPAKGDIIKLLGSADATVAEAAAVALGRLAGADAAAALRAARQKASGTLAAEIDNALLGCAERFAAEGSAAEAGKIYEAFYTAAPSRQLRCAGLRGLVVVRGEGATGLVVDAIQSDDAGLSRYAISLIERVPGTKATKAFVDVLGSLPVEGKVLMLRALGMRGDGSAAPAVVALTKDEDPAVRTAALETLGSVGNATLVPALAQAAAAGGEEQNVARAALQQIGGSAADKRLIELLGEADVPVRVEAIRALAGRQVAEAVGRLLGAAQDDDASIRSEAIRAIGALAGKSDLSVLVGLAVKTKHQDDRPALVDAAGKAFLRIEDKGACSAPVLAELQRATAETRPTLLRLLGKSGSPEALREIRGALGTSNPAAQDAAVQALADWPDTGASEDLLKLIATATNPAHKEAAVQGYVRLAAMSDDPAGMYLRALKRVERTADKKAVLEGLGLSSESPEALDLAVDFLDNADLRANAGVAALRIAFRIRQQHEQRARAAMKTVLEKVRHEDVRRRAQEVLNELDKHKDHILDWVGVGPFTEKGKSGSAVYAMVFEPETNPDGAAWKPITQGIGSWEINLGATYGALDTCAAYLRTRVLSPVEQDAQLEMGSDDGIKAWLGGKLVHDHWKESGAEPRQVIVPVKLKKGWNDLMLKVVNAQGGWVGGCRIRKPDGTALDGLQIKAP